MLKALLAAAVFAVAVASAAQAVDPQKFNTEDSAAKLCKTDNVVWFNPESKIYFAPGTQ